MLALGKEFKLYVRTLARLLYPPACAICRIPLLIEENHVCNDCNDCIEAVHPPACVRCTQPLPPYGQNSSLCQSCKSTRPHYTQGFTLVLYQESTRTIFHQIKYGKKPWLLNIFSERLKGFASRLDMNHYDLFVPVPLDPKRERDRGFNQSKLIAQILKRYTKSPICVESVLMKKKKTNPQSRLRRLERLDNLNNAFAVRNRKRLDGKRVLVVDDVFTTGSTVNECAKELKKAGAERVDFLAIGRA